MPRGFVTHSLARAVQRVPGLRRVPALKLLAVAEVMLLVREHVSRLEPAERRRAVELVRRGRGRSSGLSEAERTELTALIDKVDPRLLVGEAAEKLSPFPLPDRLVHGRARKRPR